MFISICTYLRDPYKLLTRLSKGRVAGRHRIIASQPLYGLGSI